MCSDRETKAQAQESNAPLRILHFTEDVQAPQSRALHILRAGSQPRPRRNSRQQKLQDRLTPAESSGCSSVSTSVSDVPRRAAMTWRSRLSPASLPQHVPSDGVLPLHDGAQSRRGHRRTPTPGRPYFADKRGAADLGFPSASACFPGNSGLGATDDKRRAWCEKNRRARPIVSCVPTHARVRPRVSGPGTAPSSAASQPCRRVAASLLLRTPTAGFRNRRNGARCVDDPARPLFPRGSHRAGSTAGAPFGESAAPGPHRSGYRIHVLAGAVLVIAMATLRRFTGDVVPRNHVAGGRSLRSGDTR
jgi:hypothetical protein